MKKLTREEVLHVANLAKLNVSEDDIKKFSYQLKEILDEIEKINDVEETTEEIMISPLDIECMLSDDDEKASLIKDDVLKNAPHKDDNYIIVGGACDE